MMKFTRLILFAALCALCGCATQGRKAAQDAVVYMVGDSTMANKPVIPANPERGWGQLLPMYFKPGIRIENHAVNGRSSKSFLDEGKWQPVLDHLKPGDYVIIQFAHNDEKKQSPERYTEPFGSFKTNLTRFVHQTRQHQATPILATAVARRKFDSTGKLEDTHGDYIVATRQVANELNVPSLDLNERTSELLTKMGAEQSKRLFDWIEPGEFETKPEGLKDDTHFNAYGASRVCDLAVEEIKSTVPELARWLKQ